MAALEEIGAKLVALGLGTLHTSVHLGVLPEDPPNVSCSLRETGGGPPEMGFGAAGVAWDEVSFQILVRGEPTDYTGPRGRALTAYYGLAAVEATTLSAGVGGTSAFYHFVHPIQPPFPLRQDEQDRWIFAFNVIARKDKSA